MIVPIFSTTLAGKKFEQKTRIKEHVTDYRSTSDFNPRVARYRSHRGLAFSVREMVIPVGLQLLALFSAIAILLTNI